MPEPRPVTIGRITAHSAVADSGVAIEIPCPVCGRRPFTEFSFGGEWRELDSPDPDADFARVYLPENPEGPQRERWFHAMGCRTWTTVTRDTRTNVVG